MSNLKPERRLPVRIIASTATNKGEVCVSNSLIITGGERNNAPDRVYWQGQRLKGAVVVEATKASLATASATFRYNDTTYRLDMCATDQSFTFEGMALNLYGWMNGIGHDPQNDQIFDVPKR